VRTYNFEDSRFIDHASGIKSSKDVTTDMKVLNEMINARKLARIHDE